MVLSLLLAFDINWLQIGSLDWRATHSAVVHASQSSGGKYAFTSSSCGLSRFMESKSVFKDGIGSVSVGPSLYGCVESMYMRDSASAFAFCLPLR